MAPKKRTPKQDDEPTKPVATSSKGTRRSPRLAANSKGSTSEENLRDLPPKKTSKRSRKENGEAKELQSEEVEARKKKKKPDASKDLSSTSKSRTVVIEHCKQCRSFKDRAIQVQNGLEKGISGISVLVNPEKPRRGCFEIREEGGETFISLLDMKRPFKPMKELDMDRVISDIIEKFPG